MSDLAATHCGSSCCDSGNLGGSWLIILLLIFCCGCGNGSRRMDCDDGCDSSFIIILILLLCCGCGSGCGCGGRDGGGMCC